MLTRAKLIPLYMLEEANLHFEWD